MRRRKLVLVLLGAALLLPVRAEAQSAGENQYVDPFDRSQQQAQQQQGQGQSTPSAPTGQAGASPSAAAPATSGSTPAESGQELSETASARARSVELPRTGGPAGWIAGTGLALLALGTALRVGLRRRPAAAAPSRFT